MKVIVAILLTVTSIALAKPKCFSTCSYENIVEPHPQDPASYYRCKNGCKVRVSCPLGLIFDPDTLTCTFEDDEICEEEDLVDIIVNELVKCPKGLPDNVNVLLMNPTDCGSFYQCVWGTPVRMQCPGGLHFDQKLQRCEWPHIAKCKPKSKAGAS